MNSAFVRASFASDIRMRSFEPVITVAKNRVAAAERDLAAFRRNRRTNRVELVELEAARSDAHAEFTRALKAWAAAKGPTTSTRNPRDTPNIRVNSLVRDSRCDEKICMTKRFQTK